MIGPQRFGKLGYYKMFRLMLKQQESASTGDPQAWKVVDNKRYLNVNKDVQKEWLEDVPGHIRSALETWPAINGL